MHRSIIVRFRPAVYENENPSIHGVQEYIIYSTLVLTDPTLWGGAYLLEIISTPSERRENEAPVPA